jgi:hypothetical protein
MEKRTTELIPYWMHTAALQMVFGLKDIFGASLPNRMNCIMRGVANKLKIDGML